MSKIESIKKAQLEARKARNALAATLLTTFVGEAEMIGKNARNGAPTDEEVVTLLKKFEKGMVETLKYLEGSNNEVAKNTVNSELEIIRSFLPSKLTDEAVDKMIQTLMVKFNLPKEQKSMGVVVKELKSQCGDQFDGQQVSTVFKRLIA